MDWLRRNPVVQKIALYLFLIVMLAVITRDAVITTAIMAGFTAVDAVRFAIRRRKKPNSNKQ